MTRKLLSLILIFLIVLPLEGCWDKTELEDFGYVAVIGMDKRKDKFLDVTFQVTNIQMGTSTKTNVQEPPSSIITLAATDVLVAKELADITSTRKLTFTHTVAVVVSEELARSNNFYQLIGPLYRDIDIRGEVNFIVCREKASDFIRQNNPPLETRPSKFYTFMAERWRESGIVPQSKLQKLLRFTQDDTSAYMAIYASSKNGTSDSVSEYNFDYVAGSVNKTSENPTQMIGSAIFKEGRMIGVISGEETRLSLILRPKSELQRITMTFPDPLNENYKITGILTTRKNSKIKIDVKEKEPRIYVKVPVKFELLAVPSFIDYASDLKLQQLLKDSIEEYLEGRAASLIDKSQNEFRAELFRWGYAARKTFWTLDEYKSYDWMSSYPKAKVFIDFDVSIKNFGRQIHSPSLPRVRD